MEIRGIGASRTVTLETAGLLLSAADRATPLTLSVRQIGTHGLSPPAVLALPRLGDDR